MYKRLQIFIIIAAIMTSGLFLLLKHLSGSYGYPLDDAWIHQTYARNLAASGVLAFNPGEPTAGSTSPLWTVLLAFGYLLHIPAEIWSTILGLILLTGCGLLTLDWFHLETKNPSTWMLVCCLLFVSEWHLVWASVSGMETIFQAVIFLFVCLESMRSSPRWVWIGLGIALSIWVRPDGITLLGPVLFILGIAAMGRKNKRGELTRSTVLTAIPVIISLAGYFWMNYSLSGSIWPNTFYAKQFEYQALLRTNIFFRYGSLWITILTGSNILLLPGILWGIYQAVKTRAYNYLLWIVWLLGYVLIYTLRLPVTYQHGRYIMPVIGIFIFLAILGIQRIHISRYTYRWMTETSFRGIVILVSIGFLILGARAYRIDVQVVDELMVKPAKWIAGNTLPNDLIAAHDIGALGYFGNRKVLDLAGLINPEVIPIVRDGNKIILYANGKGARYLIIFPDWYEGDVNPTGEIVYTSNAPADILQGHSNMVIYHLTN